MQYIYLSMSAQRSMKEVNSSGLSWSFSALFQILFKSENNVALIYKNFSIIRFIYVLEKQHRLL